MASTGVLLGVCVVLCIIFALFSAFYFYYFSQSVQVKDASASVINFIGALLVLGFGIFGAVVNFLKKSSLIFIVGIMMIAFFIFALIQIIITAASLADCGNTKNIFTWICTVPSNIAGGLWLFPSIVMLLISLVVGIIDCFLRKKLGDQTPSNYYA